MSVYRVADLRLAKMNEHVCRLHFTVDSCTVAELRSTALERV